jgi:hypothetical protein
MLNSFSPMVAKSSSMSHELYPTLAQRLLLSVKVTLMTANGSSNASAEGLVPVTSQSPDLVLDDFSPPTLAPTHTCKPGCPHTHSLGERGKGKVLSPSDISFSKRGKENMPGPSSLKKNETEVTNLDGPVNPLRTHQMRTRYSDRLTPWPLSNIMTD